MGDEENKLKEKSSNNIWVLILDKLIIAAIIATLAWYLESQKDEHLNSLKAENDRFLTKYDNELKTQSSQFLQDLNFKFAAEQSLKRQDFELEYEKFKNSLYLKNEKYLTSLKIENDKTLFQYTNQLQEKSDSAIENLKTGLSFSSDISKLKIEKQLTFFQKQLEEFYWPILLRLEKNNAIYTSMGQKYVGITLDTAVILPNHLEVVKIIEDKIYLATPDDDFMKAIMKYVRHVKVYWALRKIGENKLYPDKLKAEFDYPTEFYERIKKETTSLQEKYNKLIIEYQTKLGNE